MGVGPAHCWNNATCMGSGVRTGKGFAYTLGVSILNLDNGSI